VTRVLGDLKEKRYKVAAGSPKKGEKREETGILSVILLGRTEG
jgi:hypothetical protein